MSEFFQRAVVCNTSPVISLCKAGLGLRISPVFAARARAPHRRWAHSSVVNIAAYSTHFSRCDDDPQKHPAPRARCAGHRRCDRSRSDEVEGGCTSRKKGGVNALIKGGQFTSALHGKCKKIEVGELRCQR